MGYEVIDCRNKEAWLKERKERIGASDAATIMGKNKYKSVFSLWAEKHGDVEPDDLSNNEAVTWGSILEPTIREEVSKRLDVEVSYDGPYKLLVSNSHDYMSCTLDGYMTAPTMDIRDMFDSDIDGAGVLEIKTAGHYTREEFDNGGIPEAYQLQVMWQMIVTGHRWGLVAYLLEGQTFGIVPVEWNGAEASVLLSTAVTFKRWLDSDERPEPDCRDAGTISRMYPSDDGETVDLDDSFVALDEKLLQLKCSVKDDSIEIKNIEAKMKAAIGNKSFCRLPDGTMYSFKEQVRKGHSVNPATFRVLRRMKG